MRKNRSDKRRTNNFETINFYSEYREKSIESPVYKIDERPMKDFSLLLARSGTLVKITDSYSYKIVPMKKINLLFLYIASSETFFWVVQPEVAVCWVFPSTKKVYFKFSQNSQENTCVGLNTCSENTWPEACNFIQNETPTQVFSCEYCEVLKNSDFTGKL